MTGLIRAILAAPLTVFVGWATLTVIFAAGN